MNQAISKILTAVHVCTHMHRPSYVIIIVKKADEKSPAFFFHIFRVCQGLKKGKDIDNLGHRLIGPFAEKPE